MTAILHSSVPTEITVWLTGAWEGFFYFQALLSSILGSRILFDVGTPGWWQKIKSVGCSPRSTYLVIAVVRHSAVQQLLSGPAEWMWLWTFSLLNNINAAHCKGKAAGSGAQRRESGRFLPSLNSAPLIRQTLGGGPTERKKHICQLVEALIEIPLEDNRSIDMQIIVAQSGAMTVMTVYRKSFNNHSSLHRNLCKHPGNKILHNNWSTGSKDTAGFQVWQPQSFYIQTHAVNISGWAWKAFLTLKTAKLHPLRTICVNALEKACRRSLRSFFCCSVVLSIATDYSSFHL